MKSAERPSRNPLSALRVALSVVLLAGLAIGCATAPQAVDFDAMRPVPEPRFQKTGQWAVVEGALTNVPPSDASEEDIRLAREGVGVSMALVEGAEARDFDLEAAISVSDEGTAAILFRVQEAEEVVRAMYSLALRRDGVSLWRFREGRWSRLHGHMMTVASGESHALRLGVRGSVVEVGLDGEPLFAVSDTALVAPGGIGVCGMQGPCQFHEVRVKVRK